MDRDNAVFERSCCHVHFGVVGRGFYIVTSFLHPTFSMVESDNLLKSIALWYPPKMVKALERPCRSRILTNLTCFARLAPPHEIRRAKIRRIQ